jgi:hypothetical protein
MAAPVLAGIPLVYEMLVGAGILAGGAVTANKMQERNSKKQLIPIQELLMKP